MCIRDSGRTATCTETFTIMNPEPTISCPAGATVECESDIAGVIGTPTFITSCSNAATLSSEGPNLVSGNANCPGATYEIVHTVTEDARGRSASCTQTFTIANPEPTRTCPSGATVECEADIAEGTPQTSSSCGLTTTVTAV